MKFHKEFDLDELEQVASEIIRLSNSKVLLFYGEMGIGKTTLIKSLVRVLGGDAEVTSPTFSIVNEYPVKNDLVYHFDFFRINDPLEALDMGFEEYLDSGHWIFIEWPVRIDVLLPEKAVKVSLKKGEIGSRALDLELANSIR